MCGICGIVYGDKDREVHLTDLKNMCRVVTHRGPDDEGYYLKNNVGLGMRRLSIVDLQTGSQPIYNEDNSVAIVFNGEIYNQSALKDMLIPKGHSFYTKSDTEAIVHAYEEFGDECPTKLNGM